MTTNSYDPGGRLTDITHKNAAAATLANFHYTLDPNGNRTRLDQTVNGSTWTETYGLDTLDRLTSVNYSDNGQSTAYAYSPAGNRQTMTVAGAPTGNGTTNYTYDGAQQLTSYTGPAGARTLGYDGNGNQTSDGADSTFSFNSQNMMTGTSGTIGTSNNQFNANGLRVKVNGTNQLWDTTTKLPLLVNDGTTNQTYAGGALIAQTSGITSTFPLADALGSTRLVTDAAGAVSSTSRYDAYGTPRGTTGTQSAFGYTGQQTDPTGLVNLRARMYDPRLGRFTSPDAIQPNGIGTSGFGLYAYATLNPTTRVDPTGHVSLVERVWINVQVAAATALTAEGAGGYALVALCVAAIFLALDPHAYPTNVGNTGANLPQLTMPCLKAIQSWMFDKVLPLPSPVW